MTRRGLILFVSMAIIWGIPYLFIRIAVAEITPATLVFLRTSVATAILLPVALLRIDLRAVLVHWRWIAVFAAIEIAIPWVLLGSAEQHLSSSLTALLIAATPLIGTVFAVATRGTDRLTRTGVLGLRRPRRRPRDRRVGLRHARPHRAAPGLRHRRVLRDRAGHPRPAAGRRVVGRDHGALARRRRRAVRAARGAPVAGRHALDERDPVGARPGHRLHRRGVHPVRGADRRDRARAVDRHHLHQPGGRRDRRRGRALGDLHAGHGPRPRARDHRVRARDAPAHVAGRRGRGGSGRPGDGCPCRRPWSPPKPGRGRPYSVRSHR